MAVRTKRFSIGWLFVSFLLIAGGFSVAASALGLLETDGDWVRYGAYFLGAGLGGFVASRISLASTIAEPAVAGVLFAATTLALYGLLLDESVRVVLGNGLATGLGGLVGAMLGERTSPPNRTENRFWWLGVAGLVSIGFIWVAMMAIAAVTMSDIYDVQLSGGISLLLAIIVAMLGGGVTQAVAPRGMIWTCGAGFLAVAVWSLAIVSARTDTTLSVSGVIGLLIFGGLATLVGALGARIAWSVVGDRIEAERRAEGVSDNIPRAEVRS